MELICPLHEFYLAVYAIVNENEMDGNNPIVKCTLYDQGNLIKSLALIDCGTTSYIFIDEDYTHHHHLLLHLLKLLRNLTVIDRRPITSGTITHGVQACPAICNYQKNIPLIETKLGHY
jgi:hypothetical protein